MQPGSLPRAPLVFILVFALAFSAAACSSSSHGSALRRGRGSASMFDESRPRLRQIAKERAPGGEPQPYRIGPGDLVEVKVFDLEPLNREVRVGAAGDIQLPLVGTVDAAGLSAPELAAKIAGVLGSTYVKKPQVGVFVKEYESQRVAVSGAVTKPDMYPLTRDRRTIMDMVSEAGGLTEKAGAALEFSPAKKRADAEKLAKTADTAGVVAAVARRRQTSGADTIAIDLGELMRSSHDSSLNVPVAAGDVLFVPEAGKFTIQGWVEKPGTYPLSRGSTVLAALADAGGELFPARLGQVRILRRSGPRAGVREIHQVDLKAIRDGQDTDEPLLAGDIVYVPAWPHLVAGWGVFTVVNKLINVGASVPIL